MPSGQPTGLHPDVRECLHDERVAHKRREIDNKDALEKMQINNCRKIRQATPESKMQNTEPEVEKQDRENTEEEESSAYPICFISLNISLGTECYSKTDYSKLDGVIQKDAVKVNCF